jgi:hypothetical protein
MKFVKDGRVRLVVCSLEWVLLIVQWQRVALSVAAS